MFKVRGRGAYRFDGRMVHDRKIVVEARTDELAEIYRRSYGMLVSNAGNSAKHELIARYSIHNINVSMRGTALCFLIVVRLPMELPLSAGNPKPLNP